MIALIGMTGGIGCGKSMAAQYFEQLGVPVIDTDKISHALVKPGEVAYTKIAEYFGPRVLTADGALDRALLRNIVFTEPALRQWLEQLLHPLIWHKVAENIQHLTDVYCIIVVPLLLETGLHTDVDRILVVDVPELLQIQRTCARDQSSPELVKKIMAAQISRDARLSQADDVLNNSQGLEELRRQISELHTFYTTIFQRQPTRDERDG